MLTPIERPPEKVRYGASHYQQHSTQTSTVLDQLFQGYRREGVAMLYTMEDFQLEYREARLNEVTPEKFRKILEKQTLD